MRRLWIAAALLTGCLEAPTLDACYSAADCPATMSCTAGACGPPIEPPSDGALDATPDAGPPAPRCSVSAHVILHCAPGDGYAIRAAATRVDGETVALIWQGPAVTDTRVACHRRGEAGVQALTEHPIGHLGSEAPAIIATPTAVLAAWVDDSSPTARLSVQAHDHGCVASGEDAHLEANGFGMLGFAPNGDGAWLGVRYDLGDLFYGLHLTRVGPGLGPDALPARPDTTARTFAIAADAAGLAVAWTTYYDENRRDEVFAGRRALGFARRPPVIETEAEGVGVDGLAEIAGGFAIAWRRSDGTQTERKLSVLRLDGEPRVDRSVAVLTEPPDTTPGTLAADPTLGRVALAAETEGEVKLWVVHPYSDEIDAVAIGPGEYPAVVTLGPGLYGVAYGHRAGREGCLKWAEVACDLPAD